MTFVNSHLGRRAVAWGVAVTAAALVLLTIPLFDLLGYDFSFALGLLAAFAAVDVGHGAVAASRRHGRSTTLLRLTSTAVVGAGALLVVPLLAALANALRVKNCTLGSGFGFFVLLPVATVIFAASVGVLSGVLFPQRGRLVAWLVPLASLLWSLARLYVDPAVFALDPFGGYFPGPIYDEALRPPARLLYFRLVNLIWIAGALVMAAALTNGGVPGPDGPPALAWHRVRQRPLLGLAALLLTGCGIVLFTLRGPLRFHVRHQDVVAVLSRRTETPHMILFTDPRSGDVAELDLAVRDLEFRYHQLTRILGTEPTGRVVVYLFPSADAKKDLVGAGATVFTKPWRREVFLHAERFPSTRLRHELAHIFAGAFGDQAFGISLAWRLPWPRLASGLVEGLAEAADFGAPDGRSTLHQDARAIIVDGRAPPLARVIGAGFTAVSGPRAYTLAGSFCRYLLDTFGAERLRALYRSGGDFPTVYGQTVSALETRWRSFLEGQPLEQIQRARARERFRQPAIFQKVCARELAARVDDARGLLSGAPDRAVALLESVCQDDPNEPTYLLELAEALTAAKQSDRSLVITAALEAAPETTEPLRARAANLSAAVHFHAGRFLESETALRRALAAATDEAEERAALTKLRALADDQARPTLGRVLFGDTPAKSTDAGLVVHLIGEFARATPTEALGPYLMGRQLSWRDPKLALAPLAEACPVDGTTGRPIPLPPIYLKECHRLLGETAFRAGNLAQSRTLYQRLQTQATNEADRLRASDFLERIAWEENRESTVRTPKD